MPSPVVLARPVRVAGRGPTSSRCKQPGPPPATELRNSSWMGSGRHGKIRAWPDLGLLSAFASRQVQGILKTWVDSEPFRSLVEASARITILPTVLGAAATTTGFEESDHRKVE